MHQFQRIIWFIVLILFAVPVVAEDAKDKYEPQLATQITLPAIDKFSKNLADYKLSEDVTYVRKNTYGRQIFYLLASTKTTVNQKQIIAGQLPVIISSSIRKGKFRYDQIMTLDFSSVDLPENFEFNLSALALSPNQHQAWLASRKEPALFLLNLENGKIEEAVLPNKEITGDLLGAVNFFGGFEALTVDPNGDLIVALKGVTINQNAADFIPFIKYQPSTKKFKNYIYPINNSEYQDGTVVEVNALQMIDSERLLVGESGTLANGKTTNRIYIYTLPAEPKEITANEAAKDKTLLLNLKQLGWKQEKLSGLSFFSDSSTLALVNQQTTKTAPKLWLVSLVKPVVAVTAYQKILIVLALFIFAGFFYFIIKVAFVSLKKRSNNNS